jgi:hypothetical protein
LQLAGPELFFLISLSTLECVAKLTHGNPLLFAKVLHDGEGDIQIIWFIDPALASGVPNAGLSGRG